MYKSVYSLSREQLDELKEHIFYENLLEENFSCPEDIKDYIIFRIYKDISFCDDDFFCTTCKDN